jgi:hypothetical protein
MNEAKMKGMINLTIESIYQNEDKLIDIYTDINPNWRVEAMRYFFDDHPYPPINRKSDIEGLGDSELIEHDAVREYLLDCIDSDEYKDAIDEYITDAYSPTSEYVEVYLSVNNVTQAQFNVLIKKAPNVVVMKDDILLVLMKTCVGANIRDEITYAKYLLDKDLMWCTEVPKMEGAWSDIEEYLEMASTMEHKYLNLSAAYEKEAIKAQIRNNHKILSERGDN